MTWSRGVRVAAILTGWILLLTVVAAQPAIAAPLATEDEIGQTPPALSWIELADSRGVSIWNFELSLDRGGVTSPGKFFWASITDACWGAYRAWCALALWFLDWVLSLDWVHFIASPLIQVADAMQRTVSRLGLVPTLLTITALLAGLWMLKGRHTTAIWEIGIACVIASMGTGIFAQPVQMIANPNDGYIVKANQIGQEIGAALAFGDAVGKTPEQLRKQQTGQLVDTFIRQPTQMINFGKVLDGGKCEGAYTDVVKGGPYGDDSDIRDKVADCDEAAGDYAANPSAPMALGSVIFIPAAFVILALCVLLGGSVIAAGVWAMFQGVKAIVTFISGILPGGGRGSLMLTAAEVVVALIIIIFTSVFLSVFLLVIQELFSASVEESVPKTFVIVDVVITAGIFVYARQRKQIKDSAARLAQWMSFRPGGAPATRLPERGAGLGLDAASSVVRTATGLAQLRAQRAAADRAGDAFTDNRQQNLIFAVGRGRPGPPPPRRDSGPDSGGNPTRPQLPPPPSGSGPRTPTPRRIAGSLARAGAHSALAYATGGASVAATRAAKVVSVGKATRRAALAARMVTTTSRPTTPRRTSDVVSGEVLSSTVHPPARERGIPSPPPRPAHSEAGQQGAENIQRTAQLRARLTDRTRRPSRRANAKERPTDPGQDSVGAA